MQELDQNNQELVTLSEFCSEDHLWWQPWHTYMFSLWLWKLIRKVFYLRIRDNLMTLFFWTRNASWPSSDWLFRHLRSNRLLMRRSIWMSSLYQGNLGLMVRSLVVIGHTSLSTDNVIDSYASMRTLGSSELKGKSDKRLRRRSVKISPILYQILRYVQVSFCRTCMNLWQLLPLVVSYSWENKL